MENELRERIVELEQKLKEAQSQIEALTLDVHILSEELILERAPKQDIR